MAGYHLSLLRRTRYQIVAGQNIYLAQLVDTTDWSYGVLIVSIFDGNGGIFSVQVRNAMATPESQAEILVEGSTLADISAQANPGLHTRRFPDPSGQDAIARFVQVTLSSANGSDVTLAVDMVGRSG